MVQSLEAKLATFVAGLTAEESAQMGGLLVEIDRALPPTVRAKARQFVHGLTVEEAAQVALVAQRTAGALALDDKADAHGYRAAAYEESDGWKGKPGTNPNGVGKGGVPLSNLGAVLIIAAGIIWSSNVVNNGGQESPPSSTGPFW